MYHSYFGLNEQPFSIAVNPRYLYMSAQHREALAHLEYGIQSGGFVMLSGEVGTGKTTIVRALLEQLPENTEIALVLNPMATTIEMLQTICDELGVAYDAANPSIKQFTDVLYSHFLECYSQGKNTVLLVDEAQLLSPECLEQIRLLTNLETHAQKLLQVVLVGQPELNQLLAQPRLRQLSQRITARFHLRPLRLDETAAYIKHRLHIAGMLESRNPFTPNVIKRIHEFTEGIPRRINILCERALIGAYGHNQTKIDRSTVDLAQKEVFDPNGSLSIKPSHDQLWIAVMVIAGVFLISLISTYTYLLLRDNDAEQPTVSQPQANTAQRPATEPNAIPITRPLAERTAPSTRSDDSTSSLLFKGFTQSQAILFKYVGYLTSAEIYPCWTLANDNIRCVKTDLETWQEVRDINRPGILSTVNRSGNMAYHILLGITDEHALLLDTENNTQKVLLADIGPQWNGQYFYAWRIPKGYEKPLSQGQRSAAVQWVAEKFAFLDSQEKPLTDKKFTFLLKQRVTLFQQNQNLDADGIIGDATLMKLNEVMGLDPVLKNDF